MPSPIDGIVNYSYQSSGGILKIRFHTGNVFEYKGVSLAVYDVFNTSKEKDEFYKKSIKGKYSERQVFEYVKSIKVGDSSVFQPTELKFADTSTVTWSKNADGEIEASASAVAGGGSATPTSAQFSALSARVNANSVQMTSADDAISAAVASAINRVSALSVVVSNAVSAIVANSAQMTSADNALSAAIGVVSAAQAATSARVTANSAQMTSADDAISAAVVSAVNRISVLSVVVSNAVSAIVANSAQMTSADNAISAANAATSARVTANSAQMTSADDANSAAIVSAINRISALSVVVSNAVSAIVANSATMTAADNALSGEIALKNDFIKLQYEGSIAAENPTIINFSGVGVSVSAVGTDVQIRIAGGGGGSAQPTSAQFSALSARVADNSTQMTSADNAISAANAATSARVTANSAQMTSADNAISAAVLLKNNIITIENDGSVTLSNPTVLNFTGAGVSVSVSGTRADVIIAGGGGSTEPSSAQFAALASTVSAGGGVWHVVADTQGISATGLTDISGLSVTMALNGIYEIHSHIIFQMSGTSTAPKFGYSTPGAARTRAQIIVNRANTGGALGPPIVGGGFLDFTSAGNSILYSALSVLVPGVVLGGMMDVLIVSAAAGTFKIMAAVQSAASPMNVLPGSFIRAYKIG